MTEVTLSIIKPDAMERNISSKINSIIENSNLKIIAQKMIRITKVQAELFYAEHIDKPFFDELTGYIVSRKVVVQVLEGNNAVMNYRSMIGHMNPKLADKGTIREQFGIDICHNSVHGSDSNDSAQREIGLFFAKIELI